jgi:hypothetical protein
MACYDGFGNMQDGRSIWAENFVVWQGGTDILFYYPGDDNWWLGSDINDQLVWQLVGNTAGFGHAINDGRPFWAGDFNGSGGADILFYYPGDHNWFLGTIQAGQLNWSLVGNTAGFGNLADGRPIWTANFTGSGGTDVLFYYPGDDNWWLGSITGGQLTWSLVGNTLGLFGHAINDGRPFWVGDFSGSGGADVLFYSPGDDNWFLGSITAGQLTWQLVGNTVGFGHAINDGRPFWTDYFSSLTRQQILFYYPGDDNWWLGTVDPTGQLNWQLVGNTAGFGHGIYDGRPFWIDDFNADALADVLFYYPGDHNWLLGSLAGGQLNWQLVGNTAGFGNIWPGGSFWTGYFSGVFRADVLFYAPWDGNWWKGTVTGLNLTWKLLGNTGRPHRERLRLHIKIVDPTLATTAAPNLVTNAIAQIKSLYSGIGILVEIASTETLTPSATAPATVAVGACKGKTTPQQNTLFGNRNGVGGNDVVAYFVTATLPSLNGCATHPAYRDGAIVTSIASNFTLAHEIGHVLGLQHIVGEPCGPAFTPTALMTACSTSSLTGTPPPTISATEASTMLSSSDAVPC